MKLQKLRPIKCLATKMILMNKNESPYDLPEKFKEEICNELLCKNWNRYIEQSDLINTISERFSVNPENVLLTSGNMNGIDIFFKYILGDKCFIQLEPSYHRYYDYINEMGLTPLYADFLYKEDYTNLLNIIRKSPSHPVLLCNPNNPTGLFLDQEKIKYLASISQSILFVDATYYFFSSEAQERQYKILDLVDNIIYAFSLSKAFSTAGIRLGFLIGDKKILKKIRSSSDPFTNYFSALCLKKILEDKWWNICLENIQTILNNKKWLISKLESLKDIYFIDTEANFIFIKTGNKMNTHLLFSYLEKNQIGLKLCELNNETYIRITIGLKHECSNLIALITKWKNYAYVI